MRTLIILPFVTVIVMDFMHVGLCWNPGNVPAEQCRPQQTHISFGKSTDEMRIMWSTKGDCSTQVKYGSGPFTLTSSKSGESRLLNVARNTSDQQVIHQVILEALSPGTLYYYMPVSGDTSAGPYFFQTPHNQNEEVQLMVFSDVSTSSPAINSLVQEALTGKYSALLHLGNIAMNLSTENGANGDRYMTLMEQAIRTVPYMTSPGPSETEDNSFLNYLIRFSIPKELTIDQMWYSLDIGYVHLISYSTEVFYSGNTKLVSSQHDWLIKDLKAANANRNTVPWIIAFGHRPMYCTFEDPNLACNLKTNSEKSELEDIFYHYGVDVVLQSHGRSYERSFPMYKGVQVTDNYTNPLGPVHIITGGASPWVMEHNFTTPAPVWSAFRYTNDSALTYGRLQIINASILIYEQIHTTNGSVVDSFEIIQEKHGLFSTAKLPLNISAEIDKERVDSGGKSGVLNIEEVGASDSKSKLSDLLEGDNKVRLIIGVSCAAFAFAVVITIIFVKVMKKKKKVARRWEHMDINYGKKFYSKAPEKDEDNDFEIDMSDGTEPTRKLLTADD
uniref:Purple acid phosphatase n=1 Tax=Arion vulgaris TaxID=1028688 RepID=A0A0B7ASY5_9EUPU